VSTVYFETGRAKRGASGALYPQTALAGLNSLSRSGTLGLRGKVVLKVRSCAAQACEPGQVRKEAAISGNLWVTWGCLAGANYPLQAGGSWSTVGCTANPPFGEWQNAGALAPAFSVLWLNHLSNVIVRHSALRPTCCRGFEQSELHRDDIVVAPAFECTPHA
jgi:hypothetical protein